MIRADDSTVHSFVYCILESMPSLAEAQLLVAVTMIIVTMMLLMMAVVLMVIVMKVTTKEPIMAVTGVVMTTVEKAVSHYINKCLLGVTAGDRLEVAPFYRYR
ncbi:unnamed protein product [Enterobius vermicularis]|uniref:Col_cuticle_N domain-containing protein n=1 Tax=Enterobius vermicularis TaxID=51028 RepID=A0A0N4VP63_ENTVE|nr:unnamed protein product [Enterobius vermicularis]